MNRDVKERWVAALRSGEYKQGYSVLRDGQERYCCLGVLSEIAVQDGVIAPATMDFVPDCSISGTPVSYAYGRMRHGTVLPDEVVEWAGLSSENPTVQMSDYDYGPFRDSLAEINDAEHSFEYIADLIEAQL